jgi:aspartate ammonia-lyase
MKTRVEKDSLGERKIPQVAYFGIQTFRAVENFPISGLMPKRNFVDATVQIKKAAALVNKKLGVLKPEIAEAIVTAADEILEGALREWFVVDVYQAGAGTSHHMNVNEVIANRAIEILGGEKGNYQIVHPNDHVNMSQSTNDVVPTAIRIAGIQVSKELISELKKLESTLRKKAKAFDHIIKSGRTHLQDAVPIRLGQEIKAWGINVRKHLESVSEAMEKCAELGIGGTAAGTGLNAHPRYRLMMVQQLSRQLKIKFRMADDYFEAMQSLRPMVMLSGAIRNLAQDLIRIANDIRLLSSGPKTGLSELNLMPVQPGSSIMPGKVNPVIAEMLNMVCFQVIGCDTTILMAAQAGQLELNVMMPVVAYNLLHEIEILTNAVNVFNRLCIAKMTANPDRCQEYAEKSMSIVTALNPIIGYSKAAEIAKEYLKSNKSMKELILEKNLLSPEEVDKIFDLSKLTEPGIL